MGKVIYIRTSDRVLLRFEDPNRVRAWLSSGRLSRDDVYLGQDQAWHPLSDLVDLAGALVQAPALPGPDSTEPASAPAVAAAPAPVRPAVSAPAPAPVAPAAPPTRAAGGPEEHQGPSERETQRLPPLDDHAGPSAAAVAAMPVAAPQPQATPPFVPIVDARAEVDVPASYEVPAVSIPEPAVNPPQAMGPAPSALEPVVQAVVEFQRPPRPVQVAPADEPMAFPSAVDPFAKAGDGDLWASDPIGQASRRKALIKRAIPFALLVALGLGGVVALVVLYREAAIPELAAPVPPTPASSAVLMARSADPAVAAPSSAPEGREVVAPAPAAAPVTAPAAAPVKAPVAAPLPAAVPAPVVAPSAAIPPAPERVPTARTPEPAPVAPPVPSPGRAVEPVRAAEAPSRSVAQPPARASAPEPSLRTAAALREKAVVEPPARARAPAGPSDTGVRELKMPAREPVAKPARGAAAGDAVAPSEEPGTYDAHMAAGNRELNRNPAVALDEFRLAAQARPGRVEPVARMGECAVRMGDLDNADRQFRAALKLGASYGPALVGMARIQKAKENVSDARYYYTRYLEVNPKGSQADEAQSYLERNP